MKRKYIYGSVAAIILAAASYQMGNFQAKEEMKEHAVSYIEPQKEQVQSMSMKELTPDEVSAKESIDAE